MITTNIDTKRFLTIIVFLSIALFLLISIIEKPVSNLDVYDNIKSYWGIASKVVTIDSFLIFLFVKFLWKFKIFKGWLVPFPNLSGTWKGMIKSTWVDPITSERPNDIPAVLSIKQSFLSISCVMYTQEMKSVSYYACFSIDDERQTQQLVYSYDSVPNNLVSERNPRKKGSIIFEIINSKNELVGNYWTDAKTTGAICVSFWKKDNVDCYPNELGGHPVSELRSYKS